MNGRCHNDPMDFATEVCDSCGEMFCSSCLVYPRGTSKAPFCTHCAMALSGVRNRRPVKPLPRGEIKKRRKALRAQLAESESDFEQQSDHSFMPGTDLIDGPPIEEQPSEDEEQSGGLLGRFFRRKSDEPAPPPAPAFDEIAADLPEPTTTVVGGESFDLPPAPHEDASYLEAIEPDANEFAPVPPEHSAAAILEQLKDQEASVEDTWLPPAAEETATWTLPDVQQQSPLSASGPWESVAAAPEPDPINDPTPAPDPVPAFADSGAPMFVSEKQLQAEKRAEGPADTDQTGNWVPPTLRGMAPQAQTNGGELPRRRRRNDED